MKLAAAIALGIAAPLALGQEQAGTGNYLVFSVTSELQREVLYPRTDGVWHHVLVNGSAALTEGKLLDPTAIDLENLRKSLLAIRRGGR